MSKNLKILVSLVIILTFGAFMSAAYISYINLNKSYEANELQTDSASGNNQYIAPDILVKDQQGNLLNLDDFKGKPIVINFWASWCGPCQSEMPNFNEVYLKEKDNIEFIMVVLIDGSKETESSASKFISSKGYSLPIYFDQKNTSQKNYAVSSIPTTVFINKDGMVVDTFTGALSKNNLEKKLDQIR